MTNALQIAPMISQTVRVIQRIPVGELAPFLAEDAAGSWRLQVPKGHAEVASARLPRRAPLLSGYFFDRSEELACVEHNRQWALGTEAQPRFLFAYLNLSTTCSLRCNGCFQGMDKNRPRAGRKVGFTNTWMRCSTTSWRVGAERSRTLMPAN